MTTKTAKAARVTLFNLTDDNTAAEYEAALEQGREELTKLRLREDDLRVQHDEALFGKGDVADVERQLDVLAIEYGTIQKRMEGAERRLSQARKREREVASEDAAERLRDLDAQVTAHYSRIREHVEAIRAEMFAADPLFNQMDYLNEIVGRDRAGDRKSPQGVVNRTFGGKYSSRPESIRNRSVIAADQALCEMFSPAGSLRRNQTDRRSLES